MAQGPSDLALWRSGIATRGHHWHRSQGHHQPRRLALRRIGRRSLQGRQSTRKQGKIYFLKTTIKHLARECTQMRSGSALGAAFVSSGPPVNRFAVSTGPTVDPQAREHKFSEDYDQASCDGVFPEAFWIGPRRRVCVVWPPGESVHGLYRTDSRPASEGETLPEDDDQLSCEGVHPEAFWTDPQHMFCNFSGDPTIAFGEACVPKSLTGSRDPHQGFGTGKSPTVNSECNLAMGGSVETILKFASDLRWPAEPSRDAFPDEAAGLRPIRARLHGLFVAGCISGESRRHSDAAPAERRGERCLPGLRRCGIHRPCVPGRCGIHRLWNPWPP